MDFLVHCLGSVGEFRDSEIGRHVLRVGKYSRLLADAYGLPDDLVFMIEKAAPLHDIGKVGIPDNVLLKPAKLDGTEWDKMRKHVDYGYKILNGSRSNVIRMAQSIAISHHERWDGEGYPRQLKGEAIPIEGRITAIADVFDALVSKRPYKDAWVISDALANLKEQSGKAFDPTLIQLFMDNLDEVTSIYHKYSD
jgi:response regulator RpfG family c-di-GMP phosphodiesterase